MTKRRALLMEREPVENNSKLDYSTIFKILRKKEFENILEKYRVELPVVSQFDYYEKCLELLKHIEIEQLQKDMLIQLKLRTRIEMEYYSVYVPDELKLLVYFDNYKKNDYLKLNDVLQKQFGG